MGAANKRVVLQIKKQRKTNPTLRNIMMCRTWTTILKKSSKRIAQNTTERKRFYKYRNACFCAPLPQETHFGIKLKWTKKLPNLNLNIDFLQCLFDECNRKLDASNVVRRKICKTGYDEGLFVLIEMDMVHVSTEWNESSQINCYFIWKIVISSSIRQLSAWPQVSQKLAVSDKITVPLNYSD